MTNTTHNTHSDNEAEVDVSLRLSLPLHISLHFNKFSDLRFWKAEPGCDIKGRGVLGAIVGRPRGGREHGREHGRALVARAINIELG